LSIYEFVLSGDITGIPRAKCLYASLNTVKSLVDNFFKLPCTEYAGVPFPIFKQLARCVATLYKLSSMDDPIWDASQARSTVDLIEVLDRFIGNLRLACELGGDDSADNVLEKAIRIISSVRTWCSAKLVDNAVGAASAGSKDEAQDPAASESGRLSDSMSLDDIFTFGFWEGYDVF
jgi:hypothetical protein